MSVIISYQNETAEITNADELFVALDITPPQVDKLFLSQIGTKINELVNNDEDFLKILSKVLGVKGQKKIEYLECFNEGLKNVVTKGETISKTLAILADESDQEYFLKTMGEDGLRKCICTLNDICGALEWLYGKMDKYFMELVGWDYIIKFIKTGEDLGIITRYLEEKEERLLLDHMGWDSVIDCIKTIKDFYYVLTGLNTGNELYLIGRFSKEKLLDIIPFKEELDNICNYYLDEKGAKKIKSIYEGI